MKIISRKRKFCYTKVDIAIWSGRSIWTVKKDVRDGKLDPDDFWAVVKYVEAHGGRK